MVRYSNISNILSFRKELLPQQLFFSASITNSLLSISSRF
jgi:hypothetical protein